MVALASTWELDKVGDPVMPGAYARAVAKIKAGERLPVIWGHDANGSPTNWVGQIDDADETPEGLRIHAAFDLDDEAGRKAYRLAKQGRVKSLSIGYAVRRQRKAADGANELLDIDLHEVSLVLTRPMTAPAS
jgi:HK97 family phage prohead protease